MPNEREQPKEEANSGRRGHASQPQSRVRFEGDLMMRLCRSLMSVGYWKGDWIPRALEFEVTCMVAGKARALELCGQGPCRRQRLQKEQPDMTEMN